jgi:hypothetical protein
MEIRKSIKPSLWYAIIAFEETSSIYQSLILLQLQTKDVPQQNSYHTIMEHRFFIQLLS